MECLTQCFYSILYSAFVLTQETSDEFDDEDPVHPASEQAEVEYIHVALQLHRLIKSMKPVLPKKPSSEHLTKEYADECVPSMLHNFITWLIGGPKTQDILANASDKLETPEHMRARVSSICQDIVYATSNGRIIPPKHM